MELRHLRYFTAVAEELHFGRAAARLHIAQPPLSQQIRRLEEELGVVLFNRTKRRVELTAAGHAFLQETRRVFAQTERAVRTAQRASRGEIGRLAIGFVASADLDILPRVLRAWQARSPQVEIELYGMLPGQQVEALHDGHIHVGFVRLPLDDSGLVVEPIQRDPLLAVLPAGHRLARRARVRVGDLGTEPVILFPRRMAPEYYDLFISTFRRAGCTPRVAHEVVTIQTIIGLVAAGLGVSLMPATIRSLRRDGVVYRPLTPPVPHADMALAYVRDHSSPVLPAFIRTVREVTRGKRP
jgi:DNA-binding transcriptional LysR family regulator